MEAAKVFRFWLAFLGLLLVHCMSLKNTDVYHFPFLDAMAALFGAVLRFLT